MRHPVRLSKTLRRREALAAAKPSCSACAVLGNGGVCPFDEPCASRVRDLARPHAPTADRGAFPPRLRIERDPITGRWCWWVTPLPTKTLGHAATHAEALAVGLAALETASVRTTSRL